MKRLALATLAAASLLAAACSSNAANTVEAAASGTLSPSKATHYRLLSDPRAIREIDWSRPPQDLHVKGVASTTGFVPVGTVAGKGKLCTEPTAYVNLRDGSITDGTPSADAPTIAGCKGRTGGFMPATREIS